MIFIFNKAGILFLFLGGLGAWVAEFGAWALGLDESGVPWALISFCGITGGFDIVSRVRDTFRTGTSWFRLVGPFGGGHLFFIPVWILTLALWVLAA
jgi:hypothetical protein